MFWTDNYVDADLKKIEMHNCDLTVTKNILKTFLMNKKNSKKLNFRVYI